MSEPEAIKGIDLLRDEAFRALECLYIAVEPSVADDVNAKVMAYIKALEEGGCWVRCSDRLPPEDTPVLIVREGKPRIGVIRRDHPTWEETWKAYPYWDDPNNDGQDWEWESVSEWMPLPESKP